MFRHRILNAQWSRGIVGSFWLPILAGCSMSAAATGGVAAEAQQPAAPASCGAPRAEIKARLTGLIAAQTADGGIVFSGSDAWIESHPLLATMGFDACRDDHDASTLGGIYDLTSRYAAHVLSRHDQDGDFLLERGSWTTPPSDGSIEDAGYNALFALDLLNLSRIACKLGRPIEALYWYQGTQTIGKAIVQQTFDNRSRFFLPMNNATGRRENLYYGLSAMPACFGDVVGPDVSRAILERYVVRSEALAPESPHRYMEPSADPSGVAQTDILRAALLLSALHQAGMTSEAERFAAHITPAIANAAGSSDDRACADYFSCLIASGDYEALYPQSYPLELLQALSTLTGVMPEESLPAFERDVAALRAFLALPASETNRVEIAPVQEATRQVYMGISALRAKWRTRSLFTPRDRNRVAGFDVYIAADELLERAVTTLQDVETEVSRIEAARAGLEITSAALNETVVPGEPVRFRLSARASGNPVDIRSVVVGRDASPDTLFSTASPNPVPSEEARDYWHQDVSKADPGTIDPVRLWSEVRLGDGKKLRHYFTHGVYVTQPVTYTLTFPEGRTLRSGAVPIEVEITKHVNRSYVVTTEWYSPAGLKPREGQAFELAMTDKTTTGRVKLSVPVPTPCRPGGFPFLVKISGNGEDWGMLSGNLFKHYQWIFVGPFPAKENAMNVVYPPERAVNLRERYPGVIAPISWAALPARAYKEDGEVDLTSLLPRQSVGYLHTVIETSVEKPTAVWLSSGLPAVVFINGREVIRNETPNPGAPKRAVATLSQGMNNILIKLADGASQKLFFQLGDEDDLTSDDFNNNLWELVDGFAEFYERSQDQYGDTETPRIITLTYRDTNANSVSVIGSFNGWSPANATMRQSKPGQWEISLHLPPGRYAYRFLVNNNTQVIDPLASLKEPDGYGGLNSVLYVR